MKNRTCPPFFKLESNRVWRTYLGGRTLDRIEGKSIPRDSHFPEDWILSGTRAHNIGREEIDEGRSSLTADGETAGLAEWIHDFPDEILGSAHRKRYGNAPAFLLKFLDSAIRLHLQCHPTIPFAKKYLNSNSGKSEGYIILGARPDVAPYIYLGFQHPPVPETFRSAVETQDSKQILSWFDPIPVRPGDVFFVPGGLPHAIGEGIFMIEIMEPTDFAVRIEFERAGCVLPEAARFMNRGIDFACSMFDFTPVSEKEIRERLFVEPQPLPVRGKAERFSLFDRRHTPCFRAERILVSGDAELEHDSFRVLIAVSGKGFLESEGKRIMLKPYERILIPASNRRIGLHTDQTLELIAALPPEA